MDSVETAATPGLRERKKQRTRETIERVALELFAERGYHETTLADIADAADVSRRTIFSYFENKEDILFCEEGASIDGIKEMLERRPPGTTTVEALREFIASAPPPDEEALLRKKIVAANPELLMRGRAHIAGLESVLAESIAKDLGAGPDDVRPALIAASMIAAFTAVREQFQAEDDAGNHERGMEIVDQVLEFLQGGLAALQRS
jgi:AcrR family transcriptional regulator